jgi:hypothetical protein
VKKPLNPILGEIFTGYWEYPDGTKGYYVSEQTSHHPPKSSYFFMAPEHNIRIDGCLKPRSKFLGNSAASLMEGIAVLRLLNTGERLYVVANFALDHHKANSVQLRYPAEYVRTRNSFRYHEVRARRPCLHPLSRNRHDGRSRVQDEGLLQRHIQRHRRLH